MDRKIIRRVAIGSATALCLTAAPLTLATSAAVADPAPTTTLTGAQARTALDTAVAATERRALQGGARFYSTSGQLERNSSWSQLRETVTVDPSRGTIGFQSEGVGSIATAAVYVTDPCGPGGGSGARQYTSLTKSGTGTWTKLQRTDNERAGLKLIKRSGARWEFVKHPKVTVKSELAKNGWSADLKRNFFARYSVTSGTSTAAADGTHYSLAYTETRPYGVPTSGTVTLDVDQQGTLVNYVATEKVGGSDPAQTWRTTWSATYGNQSVIKPTRSLTITTKALEQSCRAVMTKTAGKSITRWTVERARTWSKSYGKPLTAARLRTFVTEAEASVEGYGLDVKVTRIAGGSRITAKHKLLKHPSVWTVTVRNGKAVAHKVS